MAFWHCNGPWAAGVVNNVHWPTCKRRSWLLYRPRSLNPIRVVPTLAMSELFSQYSGAGRYTEEECLLGCGAVERNTSTRVLMLRWKIILPHLRKRVTQEILIQAKLPVIRVWIVSLLLCRNAGRKTIKRKREMRTNIEERKLNWKWWMKEGEAKKRNKWNKYKFRAPLLLI
jgi:hypothetical protein